MNTTSMVAGFALAERHDLQHDDAVRFGIIASFMPSSPVSLLVIDMMAAREAETLAAAKNTTIQPQPVAVEVPDVITRPPQTAEAAAQVIQTAGLVPEVVVNDAVVSDALVVTAQKPPGGTEVDRGSVVSLTATAAHP